jgi:uncharacterized protein
MPHLNARLRSYFIVIFLVIFAVMSQFWQYSSSELLGVTFYILIASASYAALYLLPSILFTKLAILFLKPVENNNKWRLWSVYAVAWITSSIVLLLIYGDLKLFELYEYHFNSFVWNLMTTPGGIAALGATNDTIITVLFQISGMLFSNAFILWLSLSSLPRKLAISKRAFVSFISIMFVALLFTEGVHAYSEHTANEEYLKASSIALPFNLKSRAKHLLTNMGIQRAEIYQLHIARGEVTYPLSPIKSEPLDKYPNIIMLVAESFRWDLLDPEITPNLWAFSKESMTFNQHYSGGNRTRMGLFSMFYGLYAPYWDAFEEQKVSPVLMDVIREKDYQLALHTSQSFDYPELRNTTFAGISEEFMQEIKSGEPWQRDTQNISDIIDKLDHADKTKPSYTFMFFESTHAPYAFPEKAVIRPLYLKDMNYAKLDLFNNADGIHNRYINAAHHIDSQVGRLLDYLKQNEMLDNTIVLFTGDHGEEFMEKGHWGHGHNETFPEEQVHVPMILWIPGEQPQQIDTMTSHVQIPQTLLGHLGVTTPPKEHSSAGDLFSPLPYVVMGNYNYLSLFDKKINVTFPFTSSDYFHYSLYDSDGVKVARKDAGDVMTSLKPMIDEVLQESARFVK